MIEDKFNNKQAAFVMYMAEVLDVMDEKDLEDKISRLTSTELKELVSAFEDVYKKKEGMTIAKLGAKLEHINKLNGKCPDGYEVVKHMSGGTVKSSCKKCNGGKLNRPIPKDKKGSVISDFKNDISMKQKGGKAKSSGKPYNESEHATLLDKYKTGTASKQDSTRLQELNRTSGHHQDGWMPKKTPAKVNNKADISGKKTTKRLKGGLLDLAIKLKK